tara:strand:+ start:885 stop:1016 length:132 start_codon:yes stop_codon:yes gene_type:complete
MGIIPNISITGFATKTDEDPVIPKTMKIIRNWKFDLTSHFTFR